MESKANKAEKAKALIIVNKSTGEGVKKKHKFSQVFQVAVDEYELDVENHKLVNVGQRDLNEEVNSFKDCALDVVLDKFLNGVPIQGMTSTKKVDKVELMLQQQEAYISNMCHKYGLDPNIYNTVDMVQDELKVRANNLDRDLNKSDNPIENVSIEKDNKDTVKTNDKEDNKEDNKGDVE